VILTSLTACSKTEPQPKEFVPAKIFVTVSFKKSTTDPNGQLPEFSSRFEMTKFTWRPSAASRDSQFLYTTQTTCLEGESEAPGELTPRHKLELCFTINDPSPYTLYPPPIHTGTFRIATTNPHALGRIGYNLNVVDLLKLDLSEVDPSGHYRRRNVELVNATAEGSVEITVSNKQRLAGNFDVNDTNLTITGTFNCQFR
jgi:hypothetical protein